MSEEQAKLGQVYRSNIGRQYIVVGFHGDDSILLGDSGIVWYPLAFLKMLDKLHD